MRNDFEGNYLAHYGILGMHWGIRRYQNSDGSLTTAGKNRYRDRLKKFAIGAISGDIVAKKEGPVKEHIEKSRETRRKLGIRSKGDSDRELKKKIKKMVPTKSVKEDISKLSDQELRQRINRQQMEQQYKRMNEDNVTKGKKFAKKVLNAAVMPMAIAATTAYITSGKSYVTHGAKGLYKGIRKGLTNAYMRKLARRMLG